jgi:hypothetical protein
MSDYKTTFKTNRKRLLIVLKELKKLSTSLYSKGNIKIRILKKCIEIYGIGVVKYIESETEGYCDVYVSMKLFYDFVSTSKNEVITFSFNEGELRCGSSMYSHISITVEKIPINEELELTINFDDYSILKEYLNKGDEFIIKHNLEPKLESANKRLNSAINGAYESLKFFKFTKDEIKLFVTNKINNTK